MFYAVVIFVIGSAIQAGAVDIAGFSIGMLTMVIPLYISEVCYLLVVS